MIYRSVLYFCLNISVFYIEFLCRRVRWIVPYVCYKLYPWFEKCCFLFFFCPSQYYLKFISYENGFKLPTCQEFYCSWVGHSAPDINVEVVKWKYWQFFSPPLPVNEGFIFCFFFTFSKKPWHQNSFLLIEIWR